MASAPGSFGKTGGQRQVAYFVPHPDAGAWPWTCWLPRPASAVGIRLRGRGERYLQRCHWSKVDGSRVPLCPREGTTGDRVHRPSQLYGVRVGSCRADSSIEAEEQGDVKPRV